MVRADTQGHVARTLVAPTLSGATLIGAAHRRRAHVPLSARLACGVIAALVGSALTVSTPARVHAQTASGAVDRAALPTRNPKAKRGASTRRDDTWPADVIANARAECFSLLADLEAEYEPLDPIKAGRCGAPSPVRLISIGTGPEIKFTPPARLNCPMVAAVARWIGKRAQQRAAKQLGSRIVSVVNMSAYSCRNRNNSPTGRLSEHAFANALDVGAFKLADGKTVSVLRDWGPAERDLLAFAQRETAKEAERRRIAQERANRQRQAAARQTREASARSDPGRTPAAGANARSAAQRLVRRPRAESSTQGQALPARKAARAAQGSQTAPPSRAAANAPAAAKPPLKVTPQQAVRLAELELAVAKARLLAAERDRDLTKAESDTARLRSELEAMLNGPLDIDAFLNERRRSGRGQRRRTGEAANTATPAPRQNPGRTALDRARRQAERKLAQVDAQQAAAERREAARKRAIAARER
ncbi:MAG: extensin family protein, partial [Pseudomonadota bacterium]